MASSLLYITEQPTIVQSGIALQIATAQLYTKETTSPDARLNTVSPGVIPTIININSFGIRDYTVVNDTPIPIAPPTYVALAYLYGGIITPAKSNLKRWTGTAWVEVKTLTVFK